MMRRVDGKSNKYKRETDRLQECDMPHSQSVTLVFVRLRIQHVSKGFGKGGSGGLSDKKSLPADTAPGASFHFNSDWTLTFCIRYSTVYPSPVLTFT